MLQLDNHTALFQEKSAAVETVKLVRSDAHGVHTIHHQLRFSYRLNIFGNKEARGNMRHGGFDGGGPRGPRGGGYGGGRPF